ncbi:MAG: PAS/PAC sensor signal transduction histidine kinase [Parcubacteria group bacterium Athens0714_25]|uniref:histidine kinase n=1 Tax=Candidatus Berkelbacteria bacterium Athens1014_28 TaxID=2017145 RepID=A0A554LMW9_9BACT|nr:MAG: PAS/PAC sensor signal transduction histidine kinase [Candidatus Berkelbacteria bacterium Athens1014_28]TSD01951.1 MAG: PAS/PAC sensor signal transduction histidine kinase [Parcubacteria group bacterium Athens0714_25]
MFCQDASAPFLFLFSDIAPQLLYYSHFTGIIATLVIGSYVFFKNISSISAFLIFIVAILFSLWSIFDVITWVNIDSRIIMLSWGLMNLVEPLIYLTLLYFVSHYLREKTDYRFKFVVAILFLPILFLLSTTYNLKHFDLSVCESIQGELMKYNYSFEMLLSTLIIYFIVKNLIFVREEMSRKHIVIFSLGVIFFIISFSWANIVGNITTNWEITQYGLFGAPVFMGVLAYLIVRYKAFNVKVFGVQALMLSLIIIIASEYFFVDSLVNFVLVGITLILALGFGYILTKSVKRDIEQKEELEVLSQQLVAANVQLKKLDKAKTEFISIASHQLRTPLTAIKGYTSLIIEGSYGKISKSVEAALKKTYSANERLILLVEDLLNVSRIESGRMKYDLADVRLEDLATQSYDSLILKAEDEGLYLKINLPKNPLPVFHIDGGKVREVISNFIDNAVKYTEKGGVEVSFEIDSQSARIVISDTGIGIPKEELAYLFKKFSRGKDTSRLNATGTGLGLFVGKNIIEAHGGRVWVDSEGIGKGSKFYIQLPLKWVDPNKNSGVGMNEEVNKGK